MNNRSAILNELQEMSPVLASLPPTNPYEVPQGYFEGFAARMLERVGSEPAIQALEGLEKSNPYAVPENYFENLPDLMMHRIRALAAGSAKEETAALSPLLGNLSRRNPFELPAGYFDSLAEEVTDGAKALEVVNEELENLSPLMNGMRQKNTYTVPDGYFEELPAVLLQAVKKTKAAAQVIKISFGRKLMRYAAAAVVAGLMLTAGLKYLNPGSTVKPEAGTVVVPGNISDDELKLFVEAEGNNIAEPVAPANGAAEMSEADMREMLADVSDAELQQYLNEAGANSSSKSITN